MEKQEVETWFEKSINNLIKQNNIVDERKLDFLKKCLKHDKRVCEIESFLFHGKRSAFRHHVIEKMLDKVNQLSAVPITPKQYKQFLDSEDVLPKHLKQKYLFNENLEQSEVDDILGGIISNFVKFNTETHALSLKDQIVPSKQQDRINRQIGDLTTPSSVSVIKVKKHSGYKPNGKDVIPDLGNPEFLQDDFAKRDITQILNLKDLEFAKVSSEQIKQQGSVKKQFTKLTTPNGPRSFVGADYKAKAMVKL